MYNHPIKFNVYYFLIYKQSSEQPPNRYTFHPKRINIKIGLLEFVNYLTKIKFYSFILDLF